MTTHSAAGLDVTSMPHPEPTERHRIRPLMQQAVALDRFLRLHAQRMTGPLARLQRAFNVVRDSIDPGWGAVALIVSVMLGGFAWLSAELRRVEAKVEAVSLRLAEMPGTLQGELQAQTDRLSAFISVQRQSAIPAAPGGAAASTRGAPPPPSSTRSAHVSHIIGNLPGAAGANGASLRSGAATHATTTKVASNTISGTPRRP